MVRSQAREGFTEEVRIRLLEGDADALDEAVAAVLKRMDRNNGLLLGLLVTIIASMTTLLLSGAIR